MGRAEVQAEGQIEDQAVGQVEDQVEDQAVGRAEVQAVGQIEDQAVGQVEDQVVGQVVETSSVDLNRCPPSNCTWTYNNPFASNTCNSNNPPYNTYTVLFFSAHSAAWTREISSEVFGPQ